MDDPNVATVDALFDKVVSIIQERRLHVSFLTKSGGGVHGYMMVDPQSRVPVGSMNKLTPMLNALADFFPGGDHRNLTIEKLMRCPFSFHWKTGQPIEVELYRVRRGVNDDMEYEVWTEKVTDETQMDLDEFDYMPYESVRTFSDSIKEVVEIRKTN